MRLAKLTAVAAVMVALVGMSSLAWADDLGAGAADQSAEQKIQQDKAECLACHSAQGLQKPPREGMDLAKLGGLLINKDKLEQSVHADFSCKECHGTAVAAFPHEANARAQVKSCPECHKPFARRVTPEFKESVHVTAQLPNFTCSSCHDAHTWQKISTIATPRGVVYQDNAMCRSCHESDAKFALYTTKKRRELTVIHSWQPNPELHWTAVRCVDCHTAEKADGGVSHNILPGSKAERRCVECHSANSSLSTRLYRSKVEEARINSIGFMNGYILNEAYVLGVTRNQWLDWASLVILALLVAGLGGHGLLRFVATMLRNRGK
jgi:predicted CXXCH cytochrome family protein